MKSRNEERPEPLSLPAEEQIALCVLFEKGWKAGQAPPLDEYLEGVAEEVRGALLRELLPIEVHHRRRRGQDPTAEEYQRRFPGQEDLIRALFAPASRPGPVTVGPGTPPDGAGGRPVWPGR